MKKESLCHEMNRRCRDVQHDDSRRQYRSQGEKFALWARENGITNHDIRDDRKGVVQQYCDHLTADGKSPSTVRTYAAGVCHCLGIPQRGLDLPERTVDTMKDRSERGQQELERADLARVVDLARCLGLRRAEYGQLDGRSLRDDESGNLCVAVVGKGGKNQEQIVAPEHAATVREYWAGRAPDEKIIDRDELNRSRNADLHSIRAEHAREEYDRYADIAKTQDGRQQLRDQLWARYTDPTFGCKAYLMAEKHGDRDAMQQHRNDFAREMADGQYILRGHNAAKAAEEGRPTEYDRLALCCVSVFDLSHWRNEVTVKNYMI